MQHDLASVSVVSLLHRRGAGAEVCSIAELETALAAGIRPERIIFLGPGKTDVEIARAIEIGVRALVVEAIDELPRIAAAAAAHGTVQDVLLRVNPELTVNGSRLSMGGKPRQFGIDEAQLRGAAVVPMPGPWVRIIGIHAYCGTRILDPAVVLRNTEYVLDLAVDLAERLGFELRVVDVGGGLGVPYFDGEEAFDLGGFVGPFNELVERFVVRSPRTTVLLEAGRYLVAESGSYVTRVLSTKESQGKWFAVCDGGTNHHMAAVGIGSFVKRNFPATSLPADGSVVEPAIGEWTVTGPLCTPNDTLLSGAALALEVGSLVVLGNSGAYGPSASPGRFLSHGYPAEVLVLGDTAHLVAHRESPHDLLARQRLVDIGPAPVNTSADKELSDAAVHA